VSTVNGTEVELFGKRT